MKYKLGDVCRKIVSGGTPKSTNSEYYDGGNIPWLNTKEVNFNRIYNTEKKITKLGLANSAAKMIDENSIIIAMYGVTAGHVAINKIPLTTNQACCNLKIDSNLASYEYVYYYLLYKYDELSSLANGGAQQNLNSQIIKNFEIDLPDLKIQKKIVRILSALDQKIELNNRQNSLITELLKLSYEKTTRGSNAKTKVALQGIFNFQEGPGIRNWQYVEKNGTRFINIRCIKDDDLDLSTANMISVEEANGKYAHFMLKEGDIVVSTSGTLGRSQIIRKAHLPLCLNTSVIRFWPKEPYYYSFMYCYIISNEFLHNLDVMATGSAQRNFGPMHLRQIDIDIMDNDAIKLFEKENRPLIKKLCLNRDENISLKNIRDTLLPKLMSGGIDLERISIND